MGIAVLFMQRVPVLASPDDRVEAGSECTRDFGKGILADTVGLERSTDISTGLKLGSSQRSVRGDR